MVKFGVETKFSGGGTSTTKFKSAIVDALREMKEVASLVLLHESSKDNSEPIMASRL